MIFSCGFVLLLGTLIPCLEGVEEGNLGQGPKLGSQPQYQYKTKYFKQRVDHYNLVNNDFYQQRYLINDSYWDHEEGPIFFYTGNEGDIEAFAQNSGFMWDIALEFKALLIFAEHRYYGKSLPYGKKSLKPDPKYNGYLTSEQALADFAALLKDFKATTKNADKSAVIAFGGSYGGMLAAWFRIKFPHVCDGALAASAPVAQFDAPCDAFGRIVTSDYSQIGKECSQTIRESWKAVDNLTSTDAGLKWLNSQFHLCTPLAKKDGQMFKDYLNNLWTNVAMMNYPYPTEFLMPLPGNPVEAVCNAIMDTLPLDKFRYEVQEEEDMETNSFFKSIPQASRQNSRAEKEEEKNKGGLTPDQKVLTKIFAGVNIYFNYTGNAKCLQLSDPDEIGSSMWDYQACTEMVMPMCFDNVNDMFEKAEWNYTEYAMGCQKRWKVTPRPEMANLMYGEKDVYGASNIIFSNGLLDPWSSGGILRSVSKTVVSLIIPEGAHHLDLRGSNPHDPPSVIKTREIEKAWIRKWIDAADKRRLTRAGGGYGPDAENIIVGKYFY